MDMNRQNIPILTRAERIRIYQRAKGNKVNIVDVITVLSLLGSMIALIVGFAAFVGIPL